MRGQAPQDGTLEATARDYSTPAEQSTMIKRSARIKVTTVRRRRVKVGDEAPPRANCSVCEREVELLTRSQAAGILGLDEQATEDLIATRLIHVIRTVNENLWLCKESLFQK